MLNKYPVIASLYSIVALLYFPLAHADYQGGGYHTPVNHQAWHAFTSEKKRQYNIAHTLDKAPFPSKISEHNIIKVNLKKLAWAAYDDQGNLIKWGAASGGRDFCPDINKGCKSITGTFTIYRKQGQACKSNLFPVGKGGAPMPYCMHFSGGYALHGSPAVPDFNASHGCIRIPVAEARWINQDFAKVGKTRVNISYD